MARTFGAKDKFIEAGLVGLLSNRKTPKGCSPLGRFFLSLCFWKANPMQTNHSNLTPTIGANGTLTELSENRTDNDDYFESVLKAEEILGEYYEKIDEVLREYYETFHAFIRGHEKSEEQMDFLSFGEDDSFFIIMSKVGEIVEPYHKKIEDVLVNYSKKVGKALQGHEGLGRQPVPSSKKVERTTEEENFRERPNLKADLKAKLKANVCELLREHANAKLQLL